MIAYVFSKGYTCQMERPPEDAVAARGYLAAHHLSLSLLHIKGSWAITEGKEQAAYACTREDPVTGAQILSQWH